ncbi:DUF6090 family protein [Algoriphagus persicinus]|uniref:DUF6090 family protein n=1 Tax=Algoriphagus persicinus TaxID=3108754 RepID=UPI002B3F2C1A|nr:DUF6090 family protein [Algoriphagus sp. E1-3-M2]MEB2786808.1 DUF6090 family protein [Algoriphagus sp. E1-3-M2]
MIKFFRKIRQRLLTENKFSNYLIYAIGEIVLVVIGILIALSINNWNESLKNKKLETSYLKRIYKDLDNDLLQFERTIKLAQERNKRVLFLEQAIKNSELVNKSSDYFVKSIIYANYTYRPAISNHSFEELKSSGRLALIKNEDLRVSIAKYYDLEFSYSQFDFIREDVQLKYNEYSRGILNQEQLNWVITTYYLPDSISNISKKELDDIYQRFLSKKEFHSILPQVFESKYSTIEAMDDSNKQAEKLKREIQDELNIIRR